MRQRTQKPYLLCIIVTAICEFSEAMNTTEKGEMEQKAPSAAVGATSTESTASLGAHRSRNKHNRKHKFPAETPPKDQTSSEICGSSSARKAKRSKRQRKATGDLSPQKQPELAASSEPPPETSLAAAPERAQDEPSKFDERDVARPGASSPLMSCPSPMAHIQAEGTQSPTWMAGALPFPEERSQARIILPIFLAVAIVGVIAAVIFVLVVRGHRDIKHSYVGGTGVANSTITPVKTHTSSMVPGNSTGEARQTTPRQTSAKHRTF